MLRNESQLMNFLLQSSKMHTNYNISRLEFIRKNKSQNVNQKTCFSNDFLKKTIRKHQGCQQIVQLKLKNDYSPRKGSNPVKLSINTLSKANPYKQAIQKIRKYEEKVLSSLQKSFNISKKIFTEHKDHFSVKQSRFDLSRSKTVFSAHDLRSDLNKNMNNYEHIVMVSPETVKNSRMIQSAVIEKSKRTRIKTTSVLSNFLGQKSCSEPKLII